MNVRELFEKEYAESHNLPPETFEQYRMGDSYRLPLIAKCYRFYCAGARIVQGKPRFPIHEFAEITDEAWNSLAPDRREK